MVSDPVKAFPQARFCIRRAVELSRDVLFYLIHNAQFRLVIGPDANRFKPLGSERRELTGQDQRRFSVT